MTFKFDDVHLEYYNMQGRGEPIRFMLADLGVTWTESDETEFEEKKDDLELYPFNQMPILTINGRRIAQKNAILRYLAALTGQVGTGDIEEDLLCNQLEAAVEDLQMHYVARVYSPRAVSPFRNRFKLFKVIFADELVMDLSPILGLQEVLLTDMATTTGPKCFAQFERLLKKKTSAGGYFIFDKSPSAPEYSLLWVVSAILVLRPSVLDQFPLLEKWYKGMKERKGIKEYLASGKQIVMLNGSETGQKQYA